MPDEMWPEAPAVPVAPDGPSRAGRSLGVADRVQPVATAGPLSTTLTRVRLARQSTVLVIV